MYLDLRIIIVEHTVVCCRTLRLFTFELAVINQMRESTASSDFTGCQEHTLYVSVQIRKQGMW